MNQTFMSQYPNLVSRIGLSKFTAKHQKGRHVLINIQPGVTIDSDCLQQEKHIEKLSSCFDENFISPIVNTVKKNQSEN